MFSKEIWFLIEEALIKFPLLTQKSQFYSEGLGQRTLNEEGEKVRG